jgi:aspartate dehydrogenase
MSEHTLKKVGLIGCGAIGTRIARAIDTGELKAALAGVCDIDPERARALSESLNGTPPIMSAAQIVDAADIVVEAAHVSAVPEAVDLCIEKGKDLMVMSVGGLTPEHFERFENSAVNLYMPSGAVCGLDGVLASNLEHIDTVTLTTRKPPAGLKDAPFIVQNNIDLDSLTAEKTVFEGSPAQAIKGFPKNINVATTLYNAANVDGKFRVRIVADPAVHSNIHEINLSGALGSIRITVENVPSPDNPRTSALAYYSAIATLRKILSHVKIGT